MLNNVYSVSCVFGFPCVPHQQVLSLWKNLISKKHRIENREVTRLSSDE